jgi:hypothetical protein
MTEWKHRYLIVVEADKAHIANNHAEEWGDGEGDDETFGRVGVSGDGSLPATHYIAETKATDAMDAGIFNAAGAVPFIEIFDMSQYMSADNALATIGLQRIDVPPDG